MIMVLAKMNGFQVKQQQQTSNGGVKLSAQLSRRLRTQPIRIDLEMDCLRGIRISRAARKCWLWVRDWSETRRQDLRIV